MTKMRQFGQVTESRSCPSLLEQPLPRHRSEVGSGNCIVLTLRHIRFAGSMLAPIDEFQSESFTSRANQRVAVRLDEPS
jgi:hypothetical protein